MNIERRLRQPARIAGTGALVALLPTLAGCSLALEQPSEEGGDDDSLSRLTAPFRRIDLGLPARTRITVGARRSLLLRGDPALLQRVETSVNGDTLSIHEEQAVARSNGLSMEITVPALDAVTLSSAGTVEIHGLCGRSFQIRLTGSGMLSATGEVARLQVNVSGPGVAQLDRLAAREVNVDVSGAGSARVRASRSLALRLSGVGSIYYGGNPASVEREVTGIGVVMAF